jgi:uncharacterized coiled-coil DUF342 family protein
MYEDLLAEATDKRDRYKREAAQFQEAASEADAARRQMDEAILAIQALKAEHDRFNASASDLLG